MPQKFTDNARALLAGNIAIGDASLTVEAGKADRFPVGNTANFATPADWFKVTVIDSSGNREVMKVGTRASGSAALTNVLRGQDGTTAHAFTAGAVVVHGPVAADFADPFSGNLPALTTPGALSVGGAMSQAGLQGRFTPVGGIIMWSGSIAAIPVGWHLCDGTNGTPDLRDKFIIGAHVDVTSQAQTSITGANTQTGGSKDAIVVSHSHTTSASGTTSGQSSDHTHGVNDPGHSHTIGLNGPNSGTGGFASATRTTTLSSDVAGTGITLNGVTSDHAHSVTVAGNTNIVGSAAANANLPPYYALALIMCLSA